jgi:hypothetical protein
MPGSKNKSSAGSSDRSERSKRGESDRPPRRGGAHGAAAGGGSPPPRSLDERVESWLESQGLLDEFEGRSRGTAIRNVVCHPDVQRAQRGDAKELRSVVLRVGRSLLGESEIFIDRFDWARVARVVGPCKGADALADVSPVQPVVEVVRDGPKFDFELDAGATRAFLDLDASSGADGPGEDEGSASGDEDELPPLEPLGNEGRRPRNRHERFVDDSREDETARFTGWFTAIIPIGGGRTEEVVVHGNRVVIRGVQYTPSADELGNLRRFVVGKVKSL